MRKKTPLFKKLILHVGSHKTGTSAIQRAADRQRNSLLKQGVLYPLTGQWHDRSHHHWAYALWDEQAAANKLDMLIADLVRELKETGTNPETLLLSSEIFEKIPTKEKLRDILTYFLGDIADKVECVYFIRRQDLLVESVFKQWVKDNRIRLKSNISRFIAGQTSHLNYLDIIRAWESISCISRIYVHTNALTKDPVREFFSICEVEFSNQEVIDSKFVVNPTLDGRKLELKYFLNFLPFSEDDDGRLLGVINQLETQHETVSLFLEKERSVFIEKFKAANDELSTYCGVEPFIDDFPKRDRMFCNLSGKDLEYILQHMSVVDPKLTWIVFDKMRRMIQSF